MSSAISATSSRIAGLDGLRGIAALLVILSHASIRHMHLAPGLDFSGIGKSGVYLFFVLSAMLLTSQMLKWDSGDYLKIYNWFHYFQRRVFRIWPLFILALLVSLGTTHYGPYFLGGRGIPAIISADTFFPALFLIEEDSLLWTIAVEFKFYFLLPVICFVTYSLFKNRAVPSIMFLIPLIWVTHSGFPPETIGESPLPFLTLFLSGVICAFVYDSIRANSNTLAVVSESLAWLSVLALVITIPSVYSRLTDTVIPRAFFHESHVLYAGIWSAMILTMLYGKGWLRRALDSRPLVFLGKISYSLYIWHLCVLITVFRTLDYSPYFKAWIAVTGAILLATLSYYLIERPILRWSAMLGQSEKVGSDKCI